MTQYTVEHTGRYHYAGDGEYFSLPVDNSKEGDLLGPEFRICPKTPEYITLEDWDNWVPYTDIFYDDDLESAQWRLDHVINDYMKEQRSLQEWEEKEAKALMEEKLEIQTWLASDPNNKIEDGY